MNYVFGRAVSAFKIFVKTGQSETRINNDSHVCFRLKRNEYSLYTNDLI